MGIFNSISVIDLVNLIGLVLTVIAFIVALYQSIIARKQSQDLSLISDAMSTRYLGQFPDYLNNVVDILNTAQKKIEIIVGNPSPAYFSNQAIWLQYKQALERKAYENVEVKMVYSSAVHREARLRLQFTKTDQEWNSWKKENESKLHDFIKNSYLDQDIQLTNSDELISTLLKAQNDTLTFVFNIKNIHAKETDQFVSVQTWIVDESKAVFSIQTASTSGNNTMSHGLYTADSQFVRALRSLFNIYE